VGRRRRRHGRAEENEHRGRFARERLYSTLIGANSAPHTLMVTGPGPLDCFRAFFSQDVHVLAGRGLSPFRVRPFFAFSSLLFISSLFLFTFSISAVF
jgi:hypothetical protein